MKTRVPELHIGHPIWWHHHGTKLRVKNLDLDKKKLVFGASAAELIIEPLPEDKIDNWIIRYAVHQFAGFGSRGEVFMTTAELRTAFGLANDPASPSSEWLVSRYGADSARQRHFIRWKDFLNIPCPGTGNDGDPNISVYLSEEIKEAVRKLLA